MLEHKENKKKEKEEEEEKRNELVNRIRNTQAQDRWQQTYPTAQLTSQTSTIAGPSQIQPTAPPIWHQTFPATSQLQPQSSAPTIGKRTDSANMATNNSSKSIHDPAGTIPSHAANQSILQSRAKWSKSIPEPIPTVLPNKRLLQQPRKMRRWRQRKRRSYLQNG